MRSKSRHYSAKDAGFTIMELLISTIVFGLVLLVVTTAILQFTRVYYKGVTESNVQETARTIADTIAQGIQFNGGAVTNTTASPTPGNAYAFCIGNRQFSYQVGHQLKDSPPRASTQKVHSLVDNNSVAGCPGQIPQRMDGTGPPTIGREMLAPSMRLARMEVTSVGTNLYRVSVKVIYGDDDLLDNPTAANAKCKNIRAGTQFCAVSDITTTVVKRVE